MIVAVWEIRFILLRFSYRWQGIWQLSLLPFISPKTTHIITENIGFTTNIDKLATSLLKLNMYFVQESFLCISSLFLVILDPIPVQHS